MILKDLYLVFSECLIRKFDILGNAFLTLMSGIRGMVKSVVYDTFSLIYNPKGVGSILLGIRTQKNLARHSPVDLAFHM